MTPLVQAGVALLQRAEAEPAAFVKSLDDSIAEGERDGFLTAEEVAARGACDDRPEKHDHGVSRLRNFAPRAAADLDEAVSWMLYGPAGAVGAERLLSAALEAADLIARRPMIGRVRLELASDRYWFWALRDFPYLLVYEVAEHGRRAWRALFTCPATCPTY